MMTRIKKTTPANNPAALPGYNDILAEVVGLLESARRASARSVNAIMTATYWEIGRRIVEFEQKGKSKADYGRQIVERLSRDLTARFGRGFGRRNLFQMRSFYLAYPQIVQTLSAQLNDTTPGGKVQTVSAQSRIESAIRKPYRKPQTSSAESYRTVLPNRFPLPWSHYVKLLSVPNTEARRFYETEALRGGWSVRQLDRQIATQFYERTALSRNKAAMLRKGERPSPDDAITPEEEIKDPFVLEFLGLKDEYSENELEEALIRQLESFLLELGGDFAFVGRQRRLRVGDEEKQGHIPINIRPFNAFLLALRINFVSSDSHNSYKHLKKIGCVPNFY